MGARGLRNADLPILGGTSDPYCVCEVRGKPESRFQTQLLQDTTEPLWDYAEKIEDFGKDDVLIFTVWDHDVFGEDDLLGHAAVTYKELKGVGFEGDLPLLDAGENVKAYLKLRIEVGERGGEGHTFEDLSDVDDFELRPAFRESSQSQMSPKAHRPSLSAISTSSANTDEKSQEIVQFTSKGFMRHLISPPGSPYRLTWDLVGGLLILYDSFAIPLQQVFTMPDSTFTLVMDMITLVFWTVNMVLSTCVGYTKNGVTEMRFSKILWLYLRTWFLVDIVVVVPDWVFTAMDLANTEETGAGDAVRLLRGVRLVRTVRLIRLLKLRWIVAALTELVDSEVISIILDVVKSVTMLLFLNHFVACIWYLISNMQRGRRPTWIESYGFDADSWDYQYFTAFHWSICHFTPASMGVQAHNSAERVYSICVVVGALIGFAYLVGSITNSITQLRSMQEDAKKQFWSLRRYLKQNQVHLSLSIRIQRYLEHAWQRQKSRVSEPKIFGLLSEQLRNELQYAQSVPHMVVHPLFKHLHERSDMTMHRLSAKAVSSRQLACGDELFCPGEIATHVYFVALGQLRYTIASSGDFERVEWVDSTEDWISEPVLWTPSWTHLGCLVAQTHTDLVLVDGSKFEDIISKAPVVHELMTFYARKFMQWISAKKYGELSDIFQGEDVSKTFCDFIPTEA